MAEFLYRLGRASARRAWVVIASWLVLLGLGVGAYFAFSGTLVGTVNIPGTETTRVTDRLADEIPESAGGTGSVVFQTEDGGEFTDQQRDALATLLDDAAELDGVEDAVDPFATQQQLEEQRQELEDGRDELEDARTQLDEGREELDNGQEQLDQAQSELDQGREQLEQAKEQMEAMGVDPSTNPEIVGQEQQLDRGQEQLDQQQEQLDNARTELEEGEADYESGLAMLEDGSALLDLANGIRQVSEDGSTAVGAIVFEDSLFDVTPEVREAVTEFIAHGLPDGVTVDFSQELTMEIPEILGPSEIVGVAIALIALLILMRTLLPAIIPILSAVIGVGVATTAALALSGAIEMMSVTPVLGVMLGLAVGIDYSLFIINRHRRQLKDGYDLHESIGLANGTSGNAVVFAGATVIVALLALNVSGLGFLGLMGSVGAFGVLIAVLIATTLTPAFLGLIGMRALGKRERERIGSNGGSASASQVKPMGNLRAVLTGVAAIVLLLIIAIPALSMRLGMPTGASEPQDSTQYRAYVAIEEEFGPGMNGTLLVVADAPAAVSEDDLVSQQLDIAEQIAERDAVHAVAPIATNEDNSVLAFQVIPEEGPSAESTENLVHDLRDLSPLDGEIELGVAGSASGNIDVSEKLADALPGYLALVVGLSFVILVFVFRSLLVPLTATLGFILSLFATFGAITAVFQWGWLGGVLGVHSPEPILSFAPTIVIGILFGLAMDYQLFVASGMREAYAHGNEARTSVQLGLKNGRAVVITAAIIMISVFGAFVFSDSAMIKLMGFGLAVGVLFDAFVVRLLLIPAIMHLMGRSAWWLPKWLDRIMPNVDVEGERLERRHPGTGPVEVAAEDAGAVDGDSSTDSAEPQTGRG
ncbi:MAG TPA: MMPL family transporter [Candidatus Agrococcus pullicola]|uniref:MMPL family transporter n=1 Tax=Candidatus Agrococcus pullicola TaxID=2838429 RepID=A0A9D1YY33_9MICO|nr:MMPL family transporter [Candidatus Agrococcus pullicola]